MRFASVIATLTRAIQPNTDFHKHGDTSIVFAARDLPVHPLLPRAPNYLPMGGPPTTQANPLDSNPSYLPLFRLSSTPAPTIPRIDQGTLVHRIILSNANLRSDQARRRYIYIYIYILYQVAMNIVDGYFGKKFSNALQYHEFYIYT